jgi:glycosyltransferase A (GT-A) superfamily protein (DUF2064 family)
VTTALAIFVKTPGLSPIKTRLAASIGQRAATEFHCLAARAVAEVAGATGDGLRPCWAVAERASLGDPLWSDLPTLWQGEGPLGERLHRIYGTLQAVHERVLLVGADAPQITPALLDRAVDALRSNDARFVMGAARDGGFWLFGGRAPIAHETWCGVRYSRPKTAAQLRKALRMRDDATALPVLGDVDTAQDLAPLADALDALTAPTPGQRAIRTWLESFIRAPTA